MKYAPACDEPVRASVIDNEGRHFLVPSFWLQERLGGTPEDAAKASSDVSTWFRKQGVVKPR
jgi:hypothetical protein